MSSPLDRSPYYSVQQVVGGRHVVQPCACHELPDVTAVQPVVALSKVRSAEEGGTAHCERSVVVAVLRTARTWCRARGYRSALLPHRELHHCVATVQRRGQLALRPVRHLGRIRCRPECIDLERKLTISGSPLRPLPRSAQMLAYSDGLADVDHHQVLAQLQWPCICLACRRNQILFRGARH